MNINKIRPTKNRLVVEKLAEEEYKTAGGIIIPDVSLSKFDGGAVVQEDPEKPTFRAKVLSVGPDAKLEPGHIILLMKYAGTVIDEQFDKYLLIREDDVVAFIED